MNLFIISDAYSAKTLLPNLDYLLSESIEKVFLLNENHFQFDFSVENFHFDIILSEDIDECILGSEIIFLIDNGRLCKNISNKIQKQLEGTSKKLVVFQDLFKLDDEFDFKTNYNAKVADKPIVLIISYGDFSQKYIIELALNKIFYDNRVDIHQEFSHNVEYLFETLDRHDLLNSKIRKSIHFPIERSELIVKSITTSIMDYSEKSVDLYKLIGQACPDYLILNTNARLELDTKDIFQFFAIRYGKDVDYFIQSEYVPTYFWSKDATPLFVGRRACDIVRNEKVLNVADIHFPEILFDDILSRISFPESVRLL